MIYNLFAFIILLGLGTTTRPADHQVRKASDNLHRPMSEFPRFTEAFNTGKSLTKGIEKRAHDPLHAALSIEAEQERDDEGGPEAKKLLGAFNGITKHIRHLQPLYLGLQAVRAIDAPITLCEQLHQDLSSLSDEQNGQLAQLFTPYIFQQLAAEPHGDHFITMGELLNQCQNHKEAAVVLGLKHNEPNKKALIGGLILAQKQTLDPQIIALMKKEICAPDGLPFHTSQLGSLLKTVKGKLNQAKPQSWIDSVPSLALHIFNPDENAIYLDFQQLCQENNFLVNAQDLKSLLIKHHCTEDKDIKHFMNQIERYAYQLEGRPNWNLSFGFSSATDALRYADHKEITKQLNTHMRTLYPDILTELDEAILLNRQDAALVTTFVRSHALLAVIHGMFKELKELEADSIQRELTMDDDLQDFKVV